jgi:hypothetical protein
VIKRQGSGGALLSDRLTRRLATWIAAAVRSPPNRHCDLNATCGVARAPPAGH